MGGGFDRDPGKHNAAREADSKPAHPSAGKRTLTEAAGVQLSASAHGAASTNHTDPGAVQEAAAQGVAGGGGTLPHGDTIQRLFGHHDISGIEAHVGGPAATASRAIGAEAYATGSHVAFAGAPSLHTAAHEAAHVVQQRGGVQLEGGVGEAGDAHEQHANAVADAVVQGNSAEGLLDRYAGGGGSSAVQRQSADPKPADPASKPADPAAVAAVVKKLDAVTRPSFAGIQDGTFSVDGITTWIDAFGKTLGEAKTVAATGSSPELA